MNMYSLVTSLSRGLSPLISSQPQPVKETFVCSLAEYIIASRFGNRALLTAMPDRAP